MSGLVTLAVLVIHYLGILQPFELVAYDHTLRSRPAETIDQRILVVEVTQADLNASGGYPLSDGILARVIERLQEFEPAVIGVDMHRYRPRGSGRQALLEQFHQHPNLLSVCAFNQLEQDYGPPPELSDQQQIDQIGFSNFLLDTPFQLPLLARSSARSDAVSAKPASSAEAGTVRRQLVSYAPNLASAQSACSTPYSLSLQLAYRFLEQAGIQPLAVNDQGDWQLGAVALPPLTNRFGGYQTLDGNSAQLMVNYRAAQPGQAVSLQQALNGQVRADQVRDRLVLIGYTAPIARDRVETPYGEMAGVWVHAHMVSQLLGAVLDQRPLIGGLPQWRGLLWGDGVWIFAGALGGGASSWLNSRQTRRRWAWVVRLALALAIVSWGLFYLGLIALVQGLWLPLIPALLSGLLTGGLLAFQRAQKLHSQV
ncbi:MAG: CHASE2 domain-containing protein [Leptolyngbya sp. SIO4C1]|nr:CHASE2 domain-containing protein [Leptolyngbya sp. SIO4C1]